MMTRFSSRRLAACSVLLLGSAMPCVAAPPEGLLDSIVLPVPPELSQVTEPTNTTASNITEKDRKAGADVGQDPTRPHEHTAPFDSVFPSTEYQGPTIGIPNDAGPYPLTKLMWDAIPALKAANIRVYGWVDASYNLSTSGITNAPNTYDFIPNRFELDQAVLKIERQPDMVQQDHVDWGFRVTGLYGIDYRFTTAQGYFSNQLLKSNNLYGFDPVELYGLVYIPSVAEGMRLQVGRFISPPDIEAQLAPDNFLFSHSEMFGVDAYTETGVRADIKFSPMWTVGFALHAGTDVAPWTDASHLSGQLEFKWTSKDNNNSVYGGVDSINQGEFADGHDNLQQFNLTYTHRFNPGFLTSTEVYYLYSYDAYLGGTWNLGPLRYGTGGGAGAPLPGRSEAFGYVNYTELKINAKDYLSFRTDCLVDQRGWRDAVPHTTYVTETVGYSHRFNDLLQIRPEIKFEQSIGGNGYDGGLKNHQTIFGMDAIQRF